MSVLSRASAVLTVSALALGVTACSTVGKVLPGGGAKKEPARAETGIGVNSYLWRASLDTLKFMPLASADPFGGVINTDWYTAPESPNERFKATVFILDTRLRADALNVAITKQQRDAAGNWVDVTVTPQTESDIENAILTKARQLRLSNQG